MSNVIKITTPMDEEVVSRLKAGDRVVIDGILYTARDTAHKRLIELIEKGEPLPIELKGAVIYYVGPTPAPPGRPIGSAGPTTSVRMDAYAPKLIEHGVKGMIGKGPRTQPVKDAIVKYKAVYFAATGGAGALLSKRIKSARVIAFEDLGPEAIRELVVEEFPVVVINDSDGNDLYLQNRKQYAMPSPYYSEM
ncbi:Fe-S-containing hydro-lyase [Candidatus Sumerlaeota bacterium]|nr:Fe-S-containing hydro-lyase [Candidatus Sumerlaeota bacterium]